MMKIFASCFFFLFVLFYYSDAQIVVNRSESDQTGKALINGEESAVKPVDIPQTNIVAKDQKPVFVGSNHKEKNQNNILEVLKTFKAASLLMSKEYSSFIVDTKEKTIEYNEPAYNISAKAVEAIGQVPLWLENQLRLKFRLLAAYKLDEPYAQLVLDAPEMQKDEVGFIIAYMSVNSLKDSRFVTTKNMILKTADFIYNVDDSLQYVDLVEHGSYASRDYYTTTKYRIYDTEKKDTIWSEIPRELYYFYIVHPKLDQEGVYEKDNASATEQRTYGYDWRTFIWFNPDSVYDYTKVNKTTSKGSIKTIPLFSEVIKKPRILWDRQKGYYKFNRAFAENDHALDVIGNWCSRAVPVDVTLPRSFQPNQILIKHDGNCNEDAFLVAAACRTALIPICYLGTWSMDHVFGSVWDQDWNHYEFFRGGLAPKGNEFYGITNMLDRGSYGWKNAMVEGYRPDGFIESFTRYYADTCTFRVKVTDAAGNPLDGVMLKLYAGPSAYSNNPSQCGTVWTDFNGSATIPAGDQKFYLVQAYHPAYGWCPSDSSKAYWLSDVMTVAGTTMDFTLPYTNVTKPSAQVTSSQTPESGKFGIKAVWNTRDIITGVNSRDWQTSRFYKWNDDQKGEISFFICDSVNFEKFKSNQPFESYEYNDLTTGGNATFPLPGEGRWFVVYSNRNSTNFYQMLNAEISLVEDATRTSAKDNTVNLDENLVISPNPAINWVNISYSLGRTSNARLTICNSLGVELMTLVNSLSTEGSYNTAFDAAKLEPGMYFVRLETGMQTLTRKLIVVR
jgi:hypothetical protein